ncbi:4-carboxymuconolactone decarboxylase [Adhaeribacter pallidiroseus]|uniref:4-carboxymuconolactone decarboxylase n=2 Tax=Adhaeribacter pallidiroseus TaxID=2072847 RepID=A0A369QKY3_9BACT|nr:4-carboxymuconolactone decarboxylase [Adhaeribacter pallidiroseus]
MQAQINGGRNQGLDAKQQHIVPIATFTAKGDLPQLNQTLHKALDAGLTINEAKEVLVHLYAYCGFPRSLQGIKTLMAVVDARKTKGIIDKVGKGATPVSDSGSKYERGKKVLESLTGRPETSPKTGYAAFSPEIEIFLKEHLFADLFTRDIISYADREIATISALINLGGVEPMMQSHMGIALNIGITEAGLMQIISLIDAHGGKKEAEVAKQVLAIVINSRKK